jgi:AcrR family transcriptional regulator
MIGRVASEPSGGRANRMRGDDRREQLLEIARAVFVESGRAGARTKQITDAAGMAESSLYTYFRSKEELFEEAVLEPLDQLVGGLGERGHLDMKELHGEVFDVLDRTVPLLGAVVYGEGRDGLRFYRARLAPVFDRLRGTLEQAMAGWGTAPFDRDLRTGALIGSYAWISFDERAAGRTADRDRFVDEVSAFFVRALAAPQPQPVSDVLRAPARRRRRARRPPLRFDRGERVIELDRDGWGIPILPPGRKRLPPELRRAQLVAVARHLFSERGLAGTRTADITGLAGVNESILFQHFRSKEEIFEAAILEPLEELVSELVEHGEGYATAPDGQRLAQPRLIHVHLVEAMAEIVPLLGVALFSPNARAFYQSGFRPVMDRLEQAIGGWLDGWDHHPVDARIMATMLLGTHAWLALDNRARGRSPDPERLGAEISDFFYRGVAGW